MIEIAQGFHIQRLTVGALDKTYGPDSGRKLVASFDKGDLLVLRPHGTRRPMKLSLLDVYRFAIRCHVAAVEKRAREIRKTNGGKMASALKQARTELQN